jgi:hypothetical protein
MPTTREIIVRQLEARGQAGEMPFEEVYKRLAEYDALVATSKLPRYALLSTIVAAISAIASAAAAYFSWVATHH